MRTLGLCAFFAALLALMIALSWRPAALDAQLLELQLAERLPALAPELSRTPLELQALFIDYADDPMLVGKARLALLRYPQMTMPILALFGSEPLFREVLKDYGEPIIPPIHYFLRHDVATLAARTNSRMAFSRSCE